VITNRTQRKPWAQVSGSTCRSSDRPGDRHRNQGGIQRSPRSVGVAVLPGFHDPVAAGWGRIARPVVSASVWQLPSSERKG
jgi:hypothetical protein